MNGPEAVLTITDFLTKCFLFGIDFFVPVLLGLGSSMDSLEALFRTCATDGLTSFCKGRLELFSVHSDKHVMRQVESISVTKTGSSLMS